MRSGAQHCVWSLRITKPRFVNVLYRVQLLSETPFDGPTEKQMENSVSDAAEDELVMKDSSPDAPLLDHNVPKSPILYTATSVELTTEKQHDNGAQVAGSFYRLFFLVLVYHSTCCYRN